MGLVFSPNPNALVTPVKQSTATVTMSTPRESTVEWHAEPGAVLPSNGLDRNCIERAKAHDEEAARTLVQELYPLVIKIVRSHRPRRMDEEELVQIIFVKVFQKLDQWAGEGLLCDGRIAPLNQHRSRRTTDRRARRTDASVEVRN